MAQIYTDKLLNSNMFRRDAGLPHLRDERVARLYNKSLLLRILFVVLNDFWISNDDFGLNGFSPKTLQASCFNAMRSIFPFGVKGKTSTCPMALGS